MDNLAFTHGGNIYGIERKYRRKITDFSANINPLGLPQEVQKSLYKNFAKILHYPDPNAVSLVRKIAKRWGIDEKNILLGNGSVELIYLVVNVFKPKTTFIPVPTFSEYERAARSIGAKIRFSKLAANNGFRLNISDASKPDIFFLCHPNNPTGNFLLDDYSKAEQLANRLVFVDEAFLDFLPDEENHTLAWKAVKSRKIVVLRTFTKMFSLPGLRIGYLVAHKEIISKLKQHQSPWNTNSLAQLAAELILDDKEYIKKTHRLIEKEREFLFEQLTKITGLKPCPSVTNFILIKIENKNITSSVLRKRLIQAGILIRDCANFRGLSNRFIRIAVRSRRENLKFLGRLPVALSPHRR